jgi:hypothetical protein
MSQMSSSDRTIGTGDAETLSSLMRGGDKDPELELQ